MSRPRIEIDKADFESLLAIQCSLDEVTAYFEHKLGSCSPDTIERWCKRTYGKSFAEVSLKKRAYGKISLRRAQFRLAEKSAAMAIFLGKNYLGQSDNPSPMDTEEQAVSDDALTAALKETAEGLDAGDADADLS
jgi:hypothetical protein